MLWIRLVAATALALLLTSSPGSAALAQEQQQPVPPDTAAVRAAPRPIPAAEIPQRAEEASAVLREIRANLVSDTVVAEIDSGLQISVQTIGQRRQALTPDRLAAMYLSELEDVEREWLTYQTMLGEWRSTLERQTQTLDDQRSRLAGMHEQWQVTRDSTAAAELPEALVERAQSVLDEIAALDAEVRRPRDRMLTLQNRIADEAIIIAETLSAIQTARQTAQRRLLSADSPPLWRALGAAEREAPAPIQAGLRDRAARVGDYIERNEQRLWAHFILFLVLASAAVALRRRTRGWEIDDAAVRSAERILDRPVATGLILTLLFTRLLHPRAPSVFYELLLVIALLPLVRLVPGLVPRKLVGPMYGLIGITGAYWILEIVVSAELLSRLILLAVTAVVFGGIVHFLRQSWGAARASQSRWRRAMFLALRLGAVLLGVSVLANILGFVSLAELLTAGTITSALAGLVVLIGVRAADAVLHASVQMDTLRSLRVVRDHGHELVRRATMLVHLGAVILWLSIAARQFRLYDTLVTGLGRALTREWALGSWQISILDVFAFFVALWLGLLLARAVRLVLREDVLTRMTLPRGMPQTISTTAYYIVLVIAFFFAAGAAGFDLTKFTILAGALGVGIGFGLQNVVNNFISGLILLFERPIQIGDTIEIENLVGTVKEIGIRASIVRTYAGAEVIVPNGDLISGRVINWTLSDQLRRIEVTVGVTYGTDPRTVVDILVEQARAHADVLEHPEPYALFQGFGDSSLDFVLRFWTGNYERWWMLGSEVSMAINDALKEAGIEIPFPQRDLHVRSLDPAAGAALASSSAPESSQGTKGKALR